MSPLTCDLFILMDSATIQLHEFISETAANFFSSCCFPVQGHVGHYTNKFTETGLGTWLFHQISLRAI